MAEIETDRLTLRPCAIGDLPDMAAMWADPAVVRHIGGPLTKELVWGKLMRNAGLWSLLGYGAFVARERATGRFVGEVGFFDMRRDLEPCLDGVPEIGWALMTWAHGKGFAFEAVRGATRWFEGEFGRQRTFCLIAPENAPSLRLADRAGYSEWMRTVWRGQPTIILTR